MAVTVARRHFTVAEYERMVRGGVLLEDDRVELIEGEIIEMSPIGSLHAACVNRINAIFTKKLGSSAVVGVQNPVWISEDSEPQPDISVLRPRADFYAEAHPTPADILLLVEVADTSVEYDMEVKLPLYARAAIPEVWLVALAQKTLTRYTQPHDGKYSEVRRLARGETVSSVSLPALSVLVQEILG